MTAEFYGTRDARCEKMIEFTNIAHPTQRPTMRKCAMKMHTGGRAVWNCPRVTGIPISVKCFTYDFITSDIWIFLYTSTLQGRYSYVLCYFRNRTNSTLHISLRLNFSAVRGYFCGKPRLLNVWVPLSTLCISVFNKRNAHTLTWSTTALICFSFIIFYHIFTLY